MTKPTEYTRALDVEGAYNVRDLGGYETERRSNDPLGDVSPSGYHSELDAQ